MLEWSGYSRRVLWAVVVVSQSCYLSTCAEPPRGVVSWAVCWVVQWSTRTERCEYKQIANKNKYLFAHAHPPHPHACAHTLKHTCVCTQTHTHTHTHHIPLLLQMSPDLTSDTAVIIGQGNVAIDVARILLSGEELLKVQPDFGACTYTQCVCVCGLCIECVRI